MKNYVITVFLVLLPVFFASCEKDKNGITGDIYNAWEVTEFISVESVMYQKDKDYNPVIKIIKDGSFNVELDVNHCLGNFEITSNQKIKFFGAGCTKICCDSKFSEKFIQMLPQVESYEVEGSSMKLNVPGWGLIKLELNK